MANIKIVGNDIRDVSNRIIARILGSDIRDSINCKLASEFGGEIRDPSNPKIGTTSQAKKEIDGFGGATLAAMWLLFVR